MNTGEKVVCTTIFCFIICCAITAGSVPQPYGPLVAWGIDNKGQVSDVPAGNNFVNVTGGWEHAVALRSDGTLAAWGDNTYGQCNVPAGNDFIAVSAGPNNCLALRSDGTIVAWGEIYGYTPPTETGFVAIAAGSSHFSAIQSDHQIATWGNSPCSATKPAGSLFTALAAGGSHFVALRSDGAVDSWGCNNAGQVTPQAETNFTAVSAGYFHSLGLHADGTITGWGDGSYDLLPPPPGADFAAISANPSSRYDLSLRKNGTLFAWGAPDYGVLNVPAGGNFTTMTSGGYFGVAIREANPTISSLSPAKVPAGSAGFTLTIKGKGFVRNSTVLWKGANRTTKYVSPTKLTIKVPAKDLKKKGKFSVQVRNPEPLPYVSNATKFKVT